MSFDILLTPSAAPIWALVGAILVKLIDFIMGKRKLQLDQTQLQLGHLNTATKNLIDSLFQQMRMLEDTVKRLENELKDRDKKIDHLQDEINQLRTAK